MMAGVESMPPVNEERRQLLMLCLGFASLLALVMILSCSGSSDPQQLSLEAASSLRNGNLTQAAQILNRIISEHPASPQAKTVRYLYSFLRAKQSTNAQPLTA